MLVVDSEKIIGKINKSNPLPPRRLDFYTYFMLIVSSSNINEAGKRYKSLEKRNTI